jgi:hypothetical protein
MFEKFWPSFFAFLLLLLLLIALMTPDLVLGALFALGGFFLILFWLLIGAACLAGLLLAILVWRKANLAARRPVDGAFPLQQYRLRDGRKVLVNPNTMVGPAAIIDRDTGYQEIEHPAGWDIVARIREAVERTNTARAIFPGDHVRANRFGAMSDTPKLGAGAWRMLDGPPKRPALPEPRVVGNLPPAQLPPPPRIDPIAAITSSPPLAPAVGATATGEIVHWSLEQFPHARWHGASQGSGKTNGAKLALLGMLQRGAHIVVLDRRRFKDFGDFGGVAELIDTSKPAAFVEALQRLETIYRQRDRILGDQRAANIDALPQRLVRYVVLITEFGTLFSTVEEEGLQQAAIRPLARIMREAAATGIHLIFEDQVVEKGKWPRGVAANASGIFTGQLPTNMGAAGGYYHADKLKRYEFHHAGQIFRTWDASRLTRQLLASAPAYDPRLAVLDGVARPVADGERSGATPTPFDARSHENERSVNAEDDPGYWDEVVADWFRAHPAALTGPPLGISDLARTMCRHATGNETTYEAYKSRAYKLFHQFRNNVRLPGGERLGVDITNEE